MVSTSIYRSCYRHIEISIFYITMCIQLGSHDIVWCITLERLSPNSKQSYGIMFTIMTGWDIKYRGGEDNPLKFSPTPTTSILCMYIQHNICCSDNCTVYIMYSYSCMFNRAHIHISHVEIARGAHSELAMPCRYVRVPSEFTDSSFCTYKLSVHMYLHHNLLSVVEVL